MRVVIFPRHHGRTDHTAPENVGLPDRGHGGKIPAEGPTDHADAFEIHRRFMFRERLQTGDLVRERDVD